MSTPSKAQLLNEVHALLKKRYKPKPDPSPERLSVLEGIVYGICHEGTTREQANQSLSRFKDEFYDWNEVRVSTIEEIQGALAGMSETEMRATRIRRFQLQPKMLIAQFVPGVAVSEGSDGVADAACFREFPGTFDELLQVAGALAFLRHLSIYRQFEWELNWQRRLRSWELSHRRWV